MRKFFLSALIILNTFISFTQREQNLSDRLFMYKPNTRYHFIQGSYAWSPTNSLYGLQYKRINSTSESGIFTFKTGLTICANYTKLTNTDLLNTSIEAHVSSYPYTFGFVRFGAGIDYSTNFKLVNHLSIFPSLSLDIGGIQISYKYLINRHSSDTFSDHRVQLVFGPWIKKKAGIS